MVVRPIFPYVQRFKDKRLLGNVEQLAKLIDTNRFETWEDVRAFEEKQTEVLENCRAELAELSVRYEKWTQAVSDYDDYKKYQPVMKEYQALSGLRKNSFKKKHETELENYAIYRDRVKAVMPENMKISKPYIDKQLAEVLAQQEQIQRKSSRVATDLARLSVFKGNLREMEAQQRADDLPHASIVVIHIGPGLIEVIILRQNRLRVHHRGVIVNEALEINIQLLCNIVQGLNINGNGPVFVF